MHASVTAVAILSLTAAAYAQAPPELESSLPECAAECASTGASIVGCSIDDFSCTCGRYGAMKTIVAPCLVTSSCTPEQITGMFSTIDEICSNYYPLAWTPPPASEPIESAAPTASPVAAVPSEPAVPTLPTTPPSNISSLALSLPSTPIVPSAAATPSAPSLLADPPQPSEAVEDTTALSSAVPPVPPAIEPVTPAALQAKAVNVANSPKWKAFSTGVKPTGYIPSGSGATPKPTSPAPFLGSATSGKSVAMGGVLFAVLASLMTTVT